MSPEPTNPAVPEPGPDAEPVFDDPDGGEAPDITDPPGRDTEF